MQKDNLEAALVKMSEELEETKKSCSLTCKMLNPTINFRVGDRNYVLLKPLSNARLFVKDNITVITSSALAKNIEL